VVDANVAQPRLQNLFLLGRGFRPPAFVQVDCRFCAWINSPSRRSARMRISAASTSSCLFFACRA
jgi:hypothetical protein